MLFPRCEASGGWCHAKVKQALQQQLSRLDFVSREEFDVQTSVLQRTREKLIALEARLDELEK